MNWTVRIASSMARWCAWFVLSVSSRISRQTPFADRFPKGTFQHGCSSQARRRSYRREADGTPLPRDTGLLNVFSTQKWYHLLRCVSMRLPGGASSPCLKSGAHQPRPW
jgi:hypothetical protein